MRADVFIGGLVATMPLERGGLQGSRVASVYGYEMTLASWKWQNGLKAGISITSG